MKNKRALIFIAALLCLTAAAAVLHLTSRTEIAPGSILLTADGREKTVAVSALPLRPVEGEIVNGKGETIAVSAPGIPVSALLEHAQIDAEGVSTLSVIAADEYRARLTGDEIRESGKAYLVLEDDGSLRLIVFGDPDSKRNVTDAVRMEVQ